MCTVLQQMIECLLFKHYCIECFPLYYVLEFTPLFNTNMNFENKCIFGWKTLLMKPFARFTLLNKKI